MKSPVTTHVLDTSQGKPAQGVPVILEVRDGSGTWKEIGRGITNADGRLADVLNANVELKKGSYRLTFDTGSYFAAQRVQSMFLTVVIPFEVADAQQRYHVPLLLSPFGYSTYRGS